MTLHTISPISYRSPSVRVIGSKEVLDAFDFFHDPTCSLGHWCFNCVDTVSWSVPPSSISISISCPCSCEGDFWPSRSFFAAFCATTAAFVASCTSYTFVVAASFLLFSTNYATHSFASSFFFCATNLSASTVERVGARHSGGNVSSMSKITSSVATYGSSFHFFVGSLHALR